MAKASFSSFVIPDDPLISPLYEAMFPFSVFSSSTTPCDVLLPSDSSSSPSSSSSSCLPSDLFLSALLDREVSIRIPTAGSSNLKPFSITSDQANTCGKYYKQLPLSLFPDYSSSYDDQQPIADGGSLLIAPGVVFDLQQSTNPAAAPTATKLQDPKNKYYCEACKVGFGTSQALGGHMSSHSKVRRRRRRLLLPIMSTALHQLAAAKQNGKSSKKKKPKLGHRPVSKKIIDTVKRPHAAQASSTSNSH